MPFFIGENKNYSKKHRPVVFFLKCKNATFENLRTWRMSWITLQDVRTQSMKLSKIATEAPSRGGGGGGSTKFCTGRFRPEVQILTLLYIIFERKGTSFGYLP